MLTKKGVTYDRHGNIVSCLFCRIQAGDEPSRMVYSNESYVAFETIKPATNKHLLISPRQHIANVAALFGKSGASLVKDLLDVGKVALGEKLSEEAMFW